MIIFMSGDASFFVMQLKKYDMRLGLTDSIMGLVLNSPLCAEESVRLLEFRYLNLPKSIEFSIRPTPQICIDPESGLIQP